MDSPPVFEPAREGLRRWLKAYRTVAGVLLLVSCILVYIYNDGSEFLELTGLNWQLLTITFVWLMCQTYRPISWTFIAHLHTLAMCVGLSVVVLFWSVAFPILQSFFMDYQWPWDEPPVLAGYLFVVHGLNFVLFVVDMFLSRVQFDRWAYINTPVILTLYLAWAWIQKAAFGRYPYEMLRIIIEVDGSRKSEWVCNVLCAIHMDYQHLDWMSLLFYIIMVAGCLLLCFIVDLIHRLRDRLLPPKTQDSRLSNA